MRKTMRSHSATDDDSLPLGHRQQQPKGVSMKALSFVVIVIACLVSACSSSQLQTSREQSDKEVTMAFLDEQVGPGTNPGTWHQIPATSTPRDGTLAGPCCNP
jgi:hypothetical protein